MTAQEHPIIIETATFIELLNESVTMGYRAPTLPENLACLLGCPYLLQRGSWKTLRVNLDRCDHESIVARQLILPKLFAVVKRYGQHSDRLSVLAALNRSNCWTAVLEDLPLTYELAQALVDFVDCYSPRSLMYDCASSDVLAMLNAWLKPDTHWEKLPGVRTLCQHVFGDAWCALVLPDEHADVVGAFAIRRDNKCSLHDLIAAQKPQFLHGLCSAQDAAAAGRRAVEISLPQLDVDQQAFW